MFCFCYCCFVFVFGLLFFWAVDVVYSGKHCFSNCHSSDNITYLTASNQIRILQLVFIYFFIHFI